MGAHISFSHARPNHWGDARPGRPGDAVGKAYFSSFTNDAQKKAYGIGWLDCLSYDLGGEEMWGPRDTSDGPEVWYQPDWPRALERVHELQQKIAAHESGHRREYDEQRFPAFVEAIERCAAAEVAANCYVRIWF